MDGPTWYLAGYDQWKVIELRTGMTERILSWRQTVRFYNLGSLRTDSCHDLFQDFFHRSWVLDILAEQLNDGQPFIHAPEHVRFYFVSGQHLTPRELKGFRSVDRFYFASCSGRQCFSPFEP
jgi:hypothetical protein